MTFGGSRLSRTNKVWEIKFENRGPIATYSRSLQCDHREHLLLFSARA